MPNFFLALLYLSLWLVKVLRLPNTPALLCSNRRCADSWSSHDVAAFLLVEKMGEPRGNHRGVIRKLRKTASVIITDPTHCHWDSNP